LVATLDGQRARKATWRLRAAGNKYISNDQYTWSWVFKKFSKLSVRKRPRKYFSAQLNFWVPETEIDTDSTWGDFFHLWNQYICLAEPFLVAKKDANIFDTAAIIFSKYLLPLENFNF